MKKAFFIFVIACCLCYAETDEKCRIVASQKVMCGILDAKYIYTFSPDNSVIEKVYFPETSNRNSAVIVGKYDNFDFDSYGKEVYIKIIKDDVNAVLEDSLKPLLDIFFKDVLSKGVSKLPLPLFKDYLGDRTPISSMECYYENTFVTTYEFNKITKMKTNRRDYDLRPRKGTYCEDFFASDDLFWYPSK